MKINYLTIIVKLFNKIVCIIYAINEVKNINITNKLYVSNFVIRMQSTVIQLDIFADYMNHIWFILLVMWVYIRTIMQNMFCRIKRYYASIITLIQSKAKKIIDH